MLDEVTPTNRPEDVLLIFSGGEVLVRSDLEKPAGGYRRAMPGNGDQRSGARHRPLAKSDGCGAEIHFDSFDGLRRLITTSGEIPAASKRRSRDPVDREEPRLTYDVITCVTSPMVARLEEFKELLIAEGSSTGDFRSSPSAGPRTIRRSRLPTQFREVLEFIKRTRKEDAST